MIRILKIIVLIVFFLVFSAPSCNDEQDDSRREESLINATLDSIRGEFTAEYLSDAALFGFEKSAVLKLADFSDYMKILIDSSYDISFRRQSGDMLRNLFVTENIPLRLNDTLPLSVSEFISLGLENKLCPSSIIVDSIQIYKPLSRISTSSWKGVLSFFQASGSNETTQSFLLSGKTADFFLGKEYKAFGSDTLKIWMVRLGEIR